MSDSGKKIWHLSQSDKEKDITEFELQLWRVFNGFTRWVEECENCANDSDLTAHEISILHIIRMKGRPKSAIDIGKVLNRSDNFNIGYTIKKLLRMGLIKGIKNPSKNIKALQYEITDVGIQNTDSYRNIRLKLLIDKFYDEGINLSEMIKTISQLKATYEEAEQAAAFYDQYESKIEPKKTGEKKK